jgi:putative toxin-antitoxin system antitoxin component (TIGR02293 family)
MPEMRKKSVEVKTAVRKKRPAAQSEKKPAGTIAGSLSPIQKMRLSKEGVDKKYLEKIKINSGLDYQKLAKLLAINRATLINKKDEEKFTATQSERIIAFDSLYQKGLEVFQDKDKLNRWLNEPNRALGGEMPYAIMDNQFGREEVENLLGRIQWGVFS